MEFEKRQRITGLGKEEEEMDNERAQAIKPQLVLESQAKH